MMKYSIGQNVEIQAKLRSMYLGEDYKFVTFKGRIVPNHKWLNEDYICVYTGEPNHPISVIHKRLIVGHAFSEARTNERLFQVKSKSSGKTYNVFSRDGSITCDCVGFQFRHRCKHSDKIRQVIQNA